MTVTSYRDLKVWVVSIELVEIVYRVTSAFPKGEMFGLVIQLRRGSVSVASNIAEGHARASTREYLHHVSIALGSLAELETQLIIAERLGYVDENALRPILSKADEVGKMLRGLQKSLRGKIGAGD